MLVNVCTPAALGSNGVVVIPPAVTVTVVVPDLVVSAVEVALTVSVAAVSPAATVNKPALAVILVPDIPPVTVHVTVCAGLLVPFTVALNCRVMPLATLGVAGLTVTLVTVGVDILPPVTVTAAVPDLAVSAVEAALTVRLVRVSSEATVSFPVVSTVVPDFLPVSTIDQLTVTAGLLVPVTVALNCCVAPLATLALGGVTVTLVTMGVGRGVGGGEGVPGSS